LAVAGLFGSSVLEIALGLVFIYFILSLLCSHINEILAGALKLRARDLERGIENLLCDPDLARSVLKHPLIKAMGNTRAEVITVRMMAGSEEDKNRLASWLRAQFDRVRSLFRRPSISVHLARRREKNDFAGKPSYIDARTFSQALIDQFALATDGPVMVDRVRDSAMQMLDRGMQEIKDQATIAVGIKAVADKAQSPTDMLPEIEKLPPSAARDHLLAFMRDTKNRTMAEVRTFVADKIPSPSQPILDVIGQLSAAQPSFEKMLKSVQDLPEGPARTAMLQMIEDNPKITIARSMLSMIGSSQGGQLLASIEDLLKDQLDPANLQQLLKDLNAAATFGQMRALIEGLPPDMRGRQAALDLLDRGQAAMDALRASIERWYDNAMDRVSGVYKRRTQTWLLAIALGLALFTGADTLKITKTLSSNTDLRTALAARAGAAAANGASDLPGASALLSSTTVTTTVAVGNTTTTTITTAISNTNALLAQLGEFNQLFGYSDVLDQLPDANKPGCQQIADWWRSETCWSALASAGGISWLLWKILGLAITAVAVSLGAPFWFDLLQRIANIRAAGKRPEKSGAKAGS
jgi:hypothetical protein